jgi:hypothetical protein
VILEEKHNKTYMEQHEAAREAMIAEIQSKSKKGGGARIEKDHPDDTMELDDMPNSGTGTLGNLLGLGAKRNK